MEIEANLPHATVKQIIQKVINPNFKSSASGITETVAELAQDFITLVSELAYNECIGSGKKTIMPEHVVTVMRKCNFSIDQAEIDQFLQDLNKIKAAKPKEKLRMKMHGMTDEQLIEEQAKLIESAGLLNQVEKREEVLKEDSEDYD